MTSTGGLRILAIGVLMSSKVSLTEPGHFLKTLALPDEAEHWSMTTPWQVTGRRRYPLQNFTLINKI